MKRSSTKSKLIALAALVAIATAGIVIRVRAQVDVAPTEAQRPALFGIMGITRTQTARLSVANISSAWDPFYPPDPFVPTLEVIENGTGRTSLTLGGLPPPCSERH